jgi:hypothetical protein
LEFIIEKRPNEANDVVRADAFVEKINSVIERLISREGVLIVLEENDKGLKRELALNINYR